MCGRYAASKDVAHLMEEFEVARPPDETLPEDFNVAPSKQVYMVVDRQTDDGIQRQLRTAKWGLVPSWAKDARGGARMINARAETVAEKPAFRKAFAARRCLIPADGFYEWTPTTGPTGKPAKQPWFIRTPGEGPFVMAGLYEFWKDPGLAGEGAWLTTCTIITTQATDALGHIHDRMPMTVLPGDWDAWLDPRLTDAEGVRPLLHAPHGAEVETYAVVPLVNNVRNDGPELLQPLR